MKKLIFTLVLLSAPAFLFAQIGFGIKAGANFADLSSDDANGRTRFHAGFFANLKFGEEGKWGVTPEVLWSGQGAELDGADFNMDFVTVPIMLRWRPIDLLSLEAGPQFNFLTNAEYDGDDISDNLKSTTYTLAVGALLHLPLRFHLGARYLIGLTDMNDTDFGEELKDKTLQVSLGWTLGTK